MTVLISPRMVSVLHHIANGGDRSVLFLSVVEPCNVQLKALLKRGLIEVETIKRPKDHAFRGSEPYEVDMFRLTDAGRDELAQWVLGDEE